MQTDKTKDLVLEILRPSLFEFDDWPTEVLEHALVSELNPSEVLDSMFRFRTILTNFLQGCPLELVDHVYFRQILSSLCQDLGSMATSTK